MLNAFYDSQKEHVNLKKTRVTHQPVIATIRLCMQCAVIIKTVARQRRTAPHKQPSEKSIPKQRSSANPKGDGRDLG
jgi:hypothetical protein